MSRRDFLKFAGWGAVIATTAAIPTVAAAEKTAHGSRARSTLKVAGNKGKVDLLILGNVITMDEYKPFAEAVAIKDDTILYVGNAAVARKLCDNHTTIEDYDKKTFIHGAGFSIGGKSPTAAMLDAIYNDKSIVCESFDAHSMWPNTKAMEEFALTRTP